jgi:nitrilase
MDAQGVDLWIAPTLAIGDWRRLDCHTSAAGPGEPDDRRPGVKPVLRADQIPAAFPQRERLAPPGYLPENGPWPEEGNTVIIAPDGAILAGPVRENQETLADLDLVPSWLGAATFRFVRA